MAVRVIPPKKREGVIKSSWDFYSTTIEDFYYNVDKAVDAGPCIYLLDSMDALEASDDREKFQKGRAAWEKGKVEGSGSYGTAKAKKNSSLLRAAHNKLASNGSILIVISQTRDNIGFDAAFNPKTRGGGRSLTFYAALELWTSVKQHVKKTVRGKPRELGVVVKVRVKKGRLAGKDRTVEVPILHSLGIDDLGSCVDYLIEEGYWKENKGRIVVPEFSILTGKTREQLVEQIEANGQEKALRDLVGKVWNEIEQACEVKRKIRYK
jgi:hypothetical protein